MNVSGPTPLTPIPRSDDAALALRLNQRFAADVLQVSGDRVLLAVDGVRIVARMTSLEQAAQLAERRVAQFIVKDTAGQVLNLQLVKPGSTPGGGAASATTTPDLVSKLLSGLGMKNDASTLMLARALLSQGLPVTPSSIEQLQAALEPVDPEGQVSTGKAQAQATAGQAQTAAALKAAGLPLTPASIALTQANLLPLVDTLTRLRGRLQSLAQTALPPAVAAQLQAVLGWLDSLKLDWSAPVPELAERLQTIFATLSQSLERELAQAAHNPKGELQDATRENGPLTLALLRRELERHLGQSPVLEDIDQFLDGLRYRQFENLPRHTAPAKEQWLNLDFPLYAPGAKSGDGLEPKMARLRVAYQEQGGKRQLDLANTRLVLQVEVENGELLEVDLSIYQRRVGARFRASTPGLRDQVEAHIGDFQECLEKLGYQLQAVGCEVKRANIELGLEKSTPWANYREINIVV